MKEFFSLMGTRIAVSIKNFIEWIKVAFYYYPNFSFCKQDFFLLSQYFLISPYSISKQFLQLEGKEDLYTYGETPLTTLDYISSKCVISKDDYVIELGCGRGRGCFWLHEMLGCRVKGIDYVPLFIEKANRVKERFQLKGLDFQCEDFLKTRLEGATVIYLYGTCMEDEEIIKLIEKLKSLPVATKIITVSYSLADYAAEPLFEVMNRFTARFTWGVADVFLQRRV